MTCPLVSIILPVCNGGPHLAAAVDSLLAQTHRDFEVVAIDDGSDDGSLAVLRAAQCRDTRVRVVAREHRGLAFTWNQGLDLAHGRFVARMDADAIAYPQKIAAQLAKFAAHPGAALCGAGADSLYGERITRGRLDAICDSGDFSVLSKFYPVFVPSAVMIDRAVTGKPALRHDPAYGHAEDFDLLRRIAARHPVMAERRSLLAVRLQAGGGSARHKADMRRCHVRIVTENLAGEGLALLACMEDAANRIDRSSVQGLAVFIGALDQWIEARDPAQRESWRQGFVQLFRFLYRMVCDSGDPALVRLFIDGAQQDPLIRRRERLVARSRVPFGSSAVLRRGLSLVDAIERRVTSRPFALRSGARI